MRPPSAARPDRVGCSACTTVEADSPRSFITVQDVRFHASAHALFRRTGFHFAGTCAMARARFHLGRFMLVSRRFVAALFVLAAITLAQAQDASTTVTFILANDIYQMSAQAAADGKTRGGFARLAAVVKAERAKGGHVVFAHAGDTL